MKLTEKILKDGDSVEFDWCDSKAPFQGQSYGRAEFGICLVWRRNKLKCFYIYPFQQRDVKHFYRVDCGYSDSFECGAWTHKGMDDPKIWLHGWCKEHKCPFMRVYVPKDSKRFTVYVLSTAQMMFDKEPK